MRIVIQPENPEVHEDRIYRFAFERYTASGNIHILNTDMIEEIAEIVNGDIRVRYNDGDSDLIPNANIVTVRP